MVSERKAGEIVEHEFGGSFEGLEEAAIGRAHDTFFFRSGGERYVLKVSDGDNRFQVEAPSMRYLNRDTDVPVPRVVSFDNSKSVFDQMYFIAEYEEGENISTYEAESGRKFKYLSVEAKKNVLRSAGRTLGRLHSQTSFESFGFLESQSNELGFRDRGSWREVFREIIIEEQMENFHERFADLKPVVREFVDENLDVLDPVDSACLIHQDFRWPNVKIRGDKVSTVFDWERAVAGHSEYDLAKTEESLIQVQSEELYEKYRKVLLDSYREHVDLKGDWQRRNSFYKALRSVEAMWTFDGWTDGMSDEKKDAMENFHRDRLENRMEEFRESGP